MNHLLQEDQLLDWLGYSRRADLIKCLNSYGIRVILGKGGEVCTTLNAIDRVLTGAQNQESDDFDI